ncbi:MAG: hypothetical protein ACRDQC_12080, partial [Gaiellales bacterium]
DSRTDLSSRGAPATVPGGARQSGLPETAAPLPAALASPVPSDAYVPDVGGAIDNPGQPTKSLPFDQVPGVDPALLVGIVLVVAGTALLVLRLVARRLAEDPLLR